MRTAILFFLAVCVIGTLAQNNAIDLNWLNPGYAAMPAMTIGRSGSLSIECNVFAHATGAASSIIYYGTQDLNQANDIEVVLTTDSRVGVRLGGTTLTSTLRLSDIASSWYYLAVIISNQANGQASLTVYINGVDQTNTFPSTNFGIPLTASQRNRGFLGYGDNSAAETSGAWRWNGLIDNLAFWDLALDVTTIQRHASQTQQNFDLNLNGLIVQYDFNEGLGTKAYGVPGTAALETYTIVLSSPTASFASRTATGWQTCQGNGDPHWIDFAGNHFDTPHIEAFFPIQTCLNGPNNSPIFTINTYHITGCCWGGHTVIRAVNVRLGQSIFQYANPAVLGTVDGPFVYKEVPFGQDPANVPWKAFSPSLYSPLVLGSGLTIEITENDSGSSNGNAYIQWYAWGPPYGYASFIDYLNAGAAGGGYGWLQTGASAACTVAPSTDPYDVCTGNTRTIDFPTFQGTPISTPIVPLVPITPTPTAVCTPAVSLVAAKYCLRLVGGTSSPNPGDPTYNAYSDCMFDLCATGSIPPGVNNCPYTPANCTSCALTGQLTNNGATCTCDTGYIGSDCSQPSTITNTTLVTASTNYDGLGYSIGQYNLGVNVQAGIGASPTPTEFAGANQWTVKNSILVYIATTSALNANGSPNPTSALYIVNDATSFPTGYSYTMTLSSPLGTPLALSGAGAGVVITSDTSITFNVAPLVPSGIVIPLPSSSWSVTFNPSGLPATVQKAVGSATGFGQLDVLRVVDSTFTIYSNVVANPCAQYTTCSACAASPVCGWCRTSGGCRFGRANGPNDGSSCAAWAYDFASTARRVTQKYGYPVSPIDTTVIMSAHSAQLPIELTVNMGYVAYATWDLALVVPTGSNNQQTLNSLQNNIVPLCQRLTAEYPNLGLALSTYSYRQAASGTDANGDVAAYGAVFPLMSTQSQDPINSLVQALVLNGNANPTSGDTVNSALLRVAATQQPGWRSGARHLVLMFVDSTNVDNVVTSVATLQNALIAQNVFPVFAATPAVLSYYQSYVQSLGFGLVIPTSVGNTDLINVVENALTDASGAIGAVASTPGIIDTATLNTASTTIAGLSTGMRARLPFPVVQSGSTPGSQAVISAPGFGSATIEQVSSDKPYTTPVAATLVVGQKITPFGAGTVDGAIIFLTGANAAVLNTNSPVQATFIGNNATAGTLYQFNSAALAALPADGSGVISAATGFTQVNPGDAITDSQNRILYVSPDGNGDWGNSQTAWDNIQYTVSDQCQTSAVGVLPIFVLYADNRRPTASMSTAVTNENVPLVIYLAGNDQREHILDAVIDATVFSTLNPALAGTLYQYSSACWSGVTAATPSYTSCTVINNGDIVVAQSTTLNDPLARPIIYVPAQYANTQSIPAVYGTAPQITYHVVQEKNTALDGPLFVPLVSDKVTFSITVNWVNQAPTVNLVPSINWLSFPSGFSALVSTACNEFNAATGCTWQQNLGIPYPNLPQPAPIYFGGADVENQQLTTKILSLTCSDPLVKLLDARTGSAISTGYVIGATASDAWAPLVTFLPSQDGTGSPYCTITYNVNDGYVDSPDSATITLTLTAVPQPPRSQDLINYASSPAPTALKYTFSAWGVGTASGSAVTLASATITGCTGLGSSTLTIGSVTITCSGAQTLVLSDAAQGTSLSGISNNGGEIYTWPVSWVPSADVPSSGVQLALQFLDSQGLTSITYTQQLLYRPIDQAPQLRFIQNSNEQFSSGPFSDSITIDLGSNQLATSSSVGYLAQDVDSGAGGVTATVSMTGPQGGALTIPGVSPMTSGKYTWTAAISAVSNTLSGMSFTASKAGQWNITVSLNDNGYTGACSVTQGDPCDKYAYAFLTVNVNHKSGSSAAAAAGAAGGAALAAAAAAAVAWKKLRSPPSDSYNPWEMDDSNEGTVMNPLFEDTGKSGSNPMFESK